MVPVLTIGSLKTSGATTLAMTLAAVVCGADIPVTLIDAARDPDAADWAEKRQLSARLRVVRACEPIEIERLVRGARRRGEAAIVDAGTDPETLLSSSRLADQTLIPVRFSPLSAFAAVATDRLLAADETNGRPGRTRAFVASAVTPIPSRVARAVEDLILASPTPRLPVGLSLRAAFEAPFLSGGSLFTLADDEAPSLDRARAEAAMLAYEVGLLGPKKADLGPASASAKPVRRPLAA